MARGHKNPVCSFLKENKTFMSGSESGFHRTPRARGCVSKRRAKWEQVPGLLCTAEHKIEWGCLLRRRTRQPSRQEGRTSPFTDANKSKSPKVSPSPQNFDDGKSKVEATVNLKIIHLSESISVLFFNLPVRAGCSPSPPVFPGVVFRTVQMTSIISATLKKKTFAAFAVTHHKVAKYQNETQTAVPTLSCSVRWWAEASTGQTN